MEFQVIIADYMPGLPSVMGLLADFVKVPVDPNFSLIYLGDVKNLILIIIEAGKGAG
jgi:hypothetical protein